ncbi:MAG: T9SS type A sorting domain-containing protein [Bacteroidales bacterium]|nr:T9SS type A sorting domain-containing protein [Bacteroidales bacterium]
MKKIYTLTILLALMPVLLSAQVSRMLLAEGFTSSTCGPCAAQNPAFDVLLHNNEDIITSIKYHMNWPGAGNDPMYHHNPGDNSARKNYYSINSVPHVYLSGNYFHGTPSQISQAMLNNYSANTSPLEIQLQHRLSDDQDSVYVTMLIRADQAVSGNLVAHIAVIEKEINFTSPPGSNGEKVFRNVMKALIPSKAGTSLPDFEKDDYFFVETAWELQNVYEIDQIAAVGFVQDNNSKHVHQAANSSTEQIVPIYANDAAVKTISNATSSNCSSTMEPQATITNYGSDMLTNATIEFHINGTLVHTTDWSGNLSFLETATVDAGEITFDLQAENELDIVISQTNGQVDDYPKNNAETFDFVESINVNGVDLFLFILLDKSPEETTWELFNTNGEVIQSGGPYSTPSTTLTIPLEVSDLGCYEFVIHDAGGNGICCNNGTGYYAVIGEGNDPLFTGQAFGSLERNQFAYGYVGQQEIENESTAQLYPNPVGAQRALNLELSKSADVSVSIYDISGKQLAQRDFGMLQAGTHRLNDMINKLPKGLYIAKMQIDGQLKNQKLTIE